MTISIRGQLKTLHLTDRIWLAGSILELLEMLV